MFKGITIFTPVKQKNNDKNIQSRIDRGKREA